MPIDTNCILYYINLKHNKLLINYIKAQSYVVSRLYQDLKIL